MRSPTPFLALGAAGLLLTLMIVKTASSAPAGAPVSFDVRRVKTGQFTYQDLQQDKKVGSSKITIQQIAGSTNYRFAAEARFTTGSTGYQDQRWECVATAAFAPVSATLSFGQIPGESPAFDLKYHAGGVTGFSVSRQQSGPEVRRAIDDAVPPDTVDQRIDWAAVLASPLASGWRGEFNVYDPETGISRVSVEVGPTERVRVPAGSFECYRVVYRIEKAGGTETYQVLASRDEPRVMVREEFPNGLVTDLTALSEAMSPP